jgi:hypothetical protein
MCRLLKKQYAVMCYIFFSQEYNTYHMSDRCRGSTSPYPSSHPPSLPEMAPPPGFATATAAGPASPKADRTVRLGSPSFSRGCVLGKCKGLYLWSNRPSAEHPPTTNHLTRGLASDRPRYTACAPARSPARARARPRAAASSFLLSSPRSASLSAHPSAPFLTARAGGGADEIPAMAGPTSRLLLLARRGDCCRGPSLLPRPVHAAAWAASSPPPPPPPSLPAWSQLRR